MPLNNYELYRVRHLVNADRMEHAYANAPAPTFTSSTTPSVLQASTYGPPSTQYDARLANGFPVNKSSSNSGSSNGGSSGGGADSTGTLLALAGVLGVAYLIMNGFPGGGGGIQ